MKRRKLSFLGLVVVAAILIGVVILRTPGTEKEERTAHILPEVEEQVERSALKEPVEHKHVAYKMGETGEISVREEATEEVAPEVKAQIERLSSRDPAERRDAARKLGELGEKAAPAIPYLIEALADGRPSGVVEWVRSKLTRRYDPDIYVGLEARLALEKIGEPAVEPLISALGDRHWLVRRRAAVILGTIGDTRAVEPLLAVVERRSDLFFLGEAIQALGKIGDPRAVEPLIDVLQDERSGVRRTAATALGEIGDVRAVEPLIATLRDPGEGLGGGGLLVSMAMEALGRIRDSRAIEPLTDALESENPFVRFSAKEALMQVLDSRVTGPLTAAVVDGDWLGHEAPPLLETHPQEMASLLGIPESELMEMLSADAAINYEDVQFPFQRNVMWSLVTALFVQEGERAIEPLIACLGDEDPKVQERATIALSGILTTTRDARVAELMVAALGDTNETVRMWAVSVLKWTSGQDFGRDPATWREWWEENRDTFLEKGAEAPFDAGGTASVQINAIGGPSSPEDS